MSESKTVHVLFQVLMVYIVLFMVIMPVVVVSSPFPLTSIICMSNFKSICIFIIVYIYEYVSCHLWKGNNVTILSQSWVFKSQIHCIIMNVCVHGFIVCTNFACCMHLKLCKIVQLFDV